MKKLLLFLFPAAVVLTGCIVRQSVPSYGYTYDYSEPLVEYVPPKANVPLEYVPPIAQPVTAYEKIPEAVPTPPVYSTIPEPKPRPAAPAARPSVVVVPQQTIIRESAGAAPQAVQPPQPVAQTPSVIVADPGFGFIPSVITNTNGIVPPPTNPPPTNLPPTNLPPTNLPPTNLPPATNPPPFTPAPPDTNLVPQPSQGAFAPFTNPPGGVTSAGQNFTTNSQPFGATGTNSGATVNEPRSEPFPLAGTNQLPFQQPAGNVATQQARGTFTFTNQPAQPGQQTIQEAAGAQAPGTPGTVTPSPRGFLPVTPSGSRPATPVQRPIVAPSGQPEGRGAGSLPQ